MTVTTVQAPAPQANSQQIAQPSTSSKNFMDVMQAAQEKQAQQTQQAQKPNKAQQTGKPQQTANKQPSQAAENAQKPQDTQQAKDAAQVEMADAENVILKETADGRSSTLRGMFLNLFGVSVDGVDFSQSDEDILKDLLKQCRDPEQQFAIMLMMAFLEANPDYKLEDLAGKMPENGPALTGASPVAAVTNAILKLMVEDEDIKGFPLLDQAKAYVASGSTLKNSVAELARALNLQSVTVTEGEGGASQQSAGQESEPEAALFLQGKFTSAVAQVKQNLSGDEKRQNSTDIERLQQQVDAGVFLRSTNVMTAKTGAALYLPTGQEFVDQVRTGLMANLETAKSEFIMQLKPEGLGELTVKLSEVAGKMTLSITASNAQTQRLLEAQLPSLREVMKPYEVEVGSIVNGKEDAAARFGGSFGEQFGGHQHQAMDQDHQGPAYWLDEDEEGAEEVPVQEFYGAETINTYI